MLLGCCHCGEESASSQSASEGVPSQEIPECNTPIRCINKLVPVRWRIDVTCTGTGLCKASYDGSFVLYYTTSTCYGWKTTEFTKFDPTCTDTGFFPRFSMTLGGSASGPNFALYARLTNISGTYLTAVWVDPYPSGVYSGAQDCLAPRTLGKISTDFAGYNHGATATATPI